MNKAEYNRQYYRENRDHIAAWQRRYYQEHREEILARNKQYHEEHCEEIAEYQRQYREEHRGERPAYLKARVAIAKAWQAKHFAENPCPCSATEQLVFHHIDPSTKRANVSDMINNGSWSLATIQAEAAKCKVLCMSCHKKHHDRVRSQAERPFAKQSS